MSLFNAEDGSLCKHSKAFDLDEGLTGIELKVDNDEHVYTL